MIYGASSSFNPYPEMGDHRGEGGHATEVMVGMATVMLLATVMLQCFCVH